MNDGGNLEWVELYTSDSLSSYALSPCSEPSNALWFSKIEQFFQYLPVTTTLVAGDIKITPWI